MYCAKCWTSNPDDALFCANCGTPFPKLESSAFTPGTQPQPVAPPATQPVVPPATQPPAEHAHSSYQSQQAPPTYTPPQPQFEAARVQQNPPQQQIIQTGSKPDNTFQIIMWVISLMFSIVSIVMLLGSFSNSGNGTEQLNTVIYSVGSTVIMYCLVRALSELRNLQQP